MTAELRRDLGLFSCVMLVIGNIIGIGIFLTPGDIASHLPTATWVLVAWAIGGLLSTAGALTYGELGAAYPYAGGEYVFLREAYGPLTAFLFGWTFIMVTSTGTVALLAIGAARHMGLATEPLIKWGVFELSQTGIMALMMIGVLSYLNFVGVRCGAGVTSVITMIKVLIMCALIGLGVTIGSGHPEHFSAAAEYSAQSVWTGVALALIPMAFAYSGWNATVFVSEEVRNPTRNIPLSLVLGTVLTALIYVAMNFIYLYALPLQQVVTEKSVAGATAAILFGPGAGKAVAYLIALSALGCLNASILTNPRTLYAMSKDRLFFEMGEKVHDRYGTPSGAILFTGLWSCGLILVLGSFRKILAYLSVPLVIFQCLIVASIFVLRAKRPDLPRPYRCWGYPWIPGAYVALSVGMLWEEFRNAKDVKTGLLVCLLGIPVYYLWKKLRSQEPLGSS